MRFCPPPPRAPPPGRFISRIGKTYREGCDRGRDLRRFRAVSFRREISEGSEPEAKWQSSTYLPGEIFPPKSAAFGQWRATGAADGIRLRSWRLDKGETGAVTRIVSHRIRAPRRLDADWNRRALPLALSLSHSLGVCQWSPPPLLREIWHRHDHHSPRRTSSTCRGDPERSYVVQPRRRAVMPVSMYNRASYFKWNS